MTILEIVHYDGSADAGDGRLWVGGRRLCVVYLRGYKLAHLIDVGSFDLYHVPIEDMTRATIAEDTRPAKIARRMTARRRLYRRHKIKHPAKVIKDVVAALLNGAGEG